MALRIQGRTVAAMAVALWLAGSGLFADVLQPAVRKNAPDFSLQDANGASITLSRYKGQVVLLDFWATWCTGCKVEMPWFIEFQQKYASKGLRSIGVAMDDEGWQMVRPYLKEHPINYPVVIGNLDLLQKTFGLAPALPITLLVDRNGRIAETHQGVVDKDAFERDIQRLLQEK
jgi:cytochrome c biogenesis protein CcmG/thiol:disulfide interchange protein DsbE